MLEFKAERYVRSIAAIGKARAVAESIEKPPQKENDGTYSEYIRSQLEGFDGFPVLRDDLNSLGLTMAAMSIDRLLSFVKDAHNLTNHKIALRDVLRLLTDIEERMKDQLRSEYFLYLNQSEASFYEPKRPLMGKELQNKFPSLVYEVTEAGKCLGLSRSTAAAFHLIRCLEGSIRAISRCLSIPDPITGSDRSWMKMLGKVDTAIKQKWSNSKDRMSRDGQFFEEVYAKIASMQNPYRNSTMHLEKTYTEEEAIELFHIVKGIMKKTASRMDESGLPLA